MFAWVSYFYVPAIAIFGLPYLRYYPTGVNTLLFYALWGSMTWLYSPTKVELLGTFAIRMIFYFIPSVVLFLFDICIPSTARSFKKLGKAGLPSRGHNRWPTITEWKVFGVSISNSALSFLYQIIFSWVCKSTFRMKGLVRVNTNIPMPWPGIPRILWALLLREFFTWVAHRWLLHYPSKNYNGLDVVPVYLSRWHKTWFHTLHTLYPMTAHYDHPACYFFSRFLPFYLPVILFRMHCLEYFGYVLVVCIEETAAYSSYNKMPTAWFLDGWSNIAMEHLASGGRTHFSPWGLTDFLWGSFMNQLDAPVSSGSSSSNHRNVQRVRR